MFIGALIGTILVFSLTTYLYVSKSCELSKEVIQLKSLCRSYKKVEDSSNEVIKIQTELLEQQKEIIDVQREYIKNLEKLLKEVEEITKGEKENESNN